MVFLPVASAVSAPAVPYAMSWRLDTVISWTPFLMKLYLPKKNALDQGMKPSAR
jgi:hypothetical protein